MYICLDILYQLSVEVLYIHKKVILSSEALKQACAKLN